MSSKIVLRGQLPNILKPNSHLILYILPVEVVNNWALDADCCAHSLFDYLTINPMYWGNVDFDKLLLQDENAWVMEEGQMKESAHSGLRQRKARVQLGHNELSKTWLIVLEEPDVVAQDFKKNLVMLETFFRNKLLHPKLEYIFGCLSRNRIYWGNVNYSNVSFANKNAWAMENGQMKKLLIVGSVVRVQLGASDEDHWTLEIEQPTAVATDFAKALEAMDRSFRYKLWDHKLTYKKTSKCLRLQRPRADFLTSAFATAPFRLHSRANETQSFEFPCIYDSTEATPDTINQKVTIAPTDLRHGSIVACTVYARAFTKIPCTKVKLVLDSVRLLGSEYERNPNITRPPSTPIEL
ncbi:hypothetical protein P7C70_g1484, partial [Phenoliferia sp. Uapishka_3]